MHGRPLCSRKLQASVTPFRLYTELYSRLQTVKGKYCANMLPGDGSISSITTLLTSLPVDDSSERRGSALSNPAEMNVACSPRMTSKVDI